VDQGQLFMNPTNGGRVGVGQLPRPSNGIDPPPPGFSSGNANGIGNGNGSMPSNYSSKPITQLGAQTGAPPELGAAPSRPLSRLDEQYFKSLIMQHGSANDGDQGGLLSENGNFGARAGNLYSTSDEKRWFGREQLDTGRQIERNGRDQRQESERVGTGSAVETSAPRAKSRKVCIYFGTARGCRNGDSCPFIHEQSDADKRTPKMRSAPSQQLPYAKRLRVDS
jgi:hypothetical protein